MLHPFIMFCELWVPKKAPETNICCYSYNIGQKCYAFAASVSEKIVILEPSVLFWLILSSEKGLENSIWLWTCGSLLYHT